MKHSIKLGVFASIFGAFVLSAQTFAATNDCTQNNGTACTAYLVCNQPKGCTCTIIDRGVSSTHSIKYNDICLGSETIGNISLTPMFFPYYLGNTSGATVSFYATATNGRGRGIETLTFDPGNLFTPGVSITDFSTGGLKSIIDHSGQTIYNGGPLNQQQILKILAMTDGRVSLTYSVAPYVKQFIYFKISSYYSDAGFDKLPLTFYNMATEPSIHYVYPLGDLALDQKVLGAYPTTKGSQANYEYTIKNVGATTITPSGFLEEISADTLTSPKITLGGVEYTPIDHNGDVYTWGTIFPAIAPGQSLTFTLSASTTTGLRANDDITTIGTIQSDRETTLVNNTSELSYTIPLIIDIATTSIDSGFVNPESSGEIVGFTIHYTNSGNDFTRGLRLLASLSGTSFGNQTINLSDIDMNTDAIFVITGRILQNYPLGTQFCLSGTLVATNETENTTNNIFPNLCYTFVDHADVVINGRLATAVDTINRGDLLNYIITLSNSGARVATGISFSTLLSPILTIVSGGSLGNITLQPGESRDFALQARLNSLPLNGTDIVLTGTALFGGIESNTTNNIFFVSTHLLGLSDVYVRHSINPFSGFKQGDIVTYTITYGNSGARTADNVQLTIVLPSVLQASPTSWNIGSLAPGQTASVTVTATLNSFLAEGTNFTSQAIVTTTTPQTTISNDNSTLSSTIGSIYNFAFDVSAQNITRPALTIDPQRLVRAVSGDVIVFTVTYANNGNVNGNNTTVTINNAGRLLLAGYAGNIGSLGVNQQGTLIITGTVIGGNFDPFSPVVRLSFNATGLSDSLTIEEQYACGDGMITKNEPCDGSLGILPGQECVNQQGQCTVVTRYIANIACAEYAGGKVCSDPAIINLRAASCGSLEVSKTSSSSSNVQALCIGNYANTYTPVSINCGNGTILNGYATVAGNFAGTCSYNSSNEADRAQISCSVGNDTINSACIRNVGSCTLDTDAEIAIVNEDQEGEIEYTCRTQNGQQASLSVDCGNGTISDPEVGTRTTYTCHYTEDDYNNLSNNKTLEARCLVNGARSCTHDITLDPGFLGICGNGIVEGYEQCDKGGIRGEGGNCQRGCTLGETPASCLSVSNGNISLEQGEFLPFWWKLQTNNESKYTTHNNCDADSDKNKILLDGLTCTFEIQKPGEAGAADTYEIYKDKCNVSPDSSYKIFDYFSSYTAGARKYAVSWDRFGDFVGNSFGEYKLRLKSVEYNYCDEHGDLQSSETDNVCETNFVITKPYLVQKSAFGLTPKATNINLDNFYDINGSKLINKTDLDQVMVLDATDYRTPNISNAVQTFLNTYKKLSIANKYLPAQLQSLKVSKAGVANKNIYVIEKGNSDQSTITINGKEWNSSPFTIITYGLNVIIKGDVNVNGMFIVNNGNISFESEDCNKQQLVKGIFIINKGSFTSPKVNNTDPKNPWCNAGGLYVKGVLIGDGLDTLVQNKRSSLTNWFKVSGSENSIKTQRRNQIFNGAAVQIEYNPDLWKQLPPGAEEFTKVLDIYKK